MGIEIERKFLIVDDGWRQNVKRTLHITDSLIARFDAGKARIRKCDGGYTLTIKGVRRGLTRSEYVIDLNASDAEAMINDFSKGPGLSKTRSEVLVAGVEWQVDEWGGSLQGLVTADVELREESHVLHIPSWAGPEITNDPRFSSGRLALLRNASGLEAFFKEVDALKKV